MGVVTVLYLHQRLPGLGGPWGMHWQLAVVKISESSELCLSWCSPDFAVLEEQARTGFSHNHG